MDQHPEVTFKTYADETEFMLEAGFQKWPKLDYRSETVDAEGWPFLDAIGKDFCRRYPHTKLGFACNQGARLWLIVQVVGLIRAGEITREMLQKKGGFWRSPGIRYFQMHGPLQKFLGRVLTEEERSSLKLLALTDYTILDVIIEVLTHCLWRNPNAFQTLGQNP